MASMLPDNPSLSRLREQARSLQRQARAGDPDAVESIHRHHPRPDRVLAQLADRFALHDAQVIVARRYGFTGWPALVRYLDTAATLTVDPSRVDEGALGEADRFCALAVLHYTDVDAPPRWADADELLTRTPDLTEDHVWAAAAAADAGALRRLLRVDPTQAVAAGGPFGWPPLMYLCYSRATTSPAETLDAATLLLDAGADPNAGYLWRGMATPFTALTGVFGEGEQGPRRQPRHPFCTELATLLLDRGAHPVDHQTLYNRMFRPDDSHLELLFAHGLADAGPSPGAPPRRGDGDTGPDVAPTGRSGLRRTAFPPGSRCWPGTGSTSGASRWSRRRSPPTADGRDQERRDSAAPRRLGRDLEMIGRLSRPAPIREWSTTGSARHRSSGPNTLTRARPRPAQGALVSVSCHCRAAISSGTSTSVSSAMSSSVSPG